MKKLIGIMLCVILAVGCVFGLVGCGREADNGGGNGGGDIGGGDIGGGDIGGGDIGGGDIGEEQPTGKTDAEIIAELSKIVNYKATIDILDDGVGVKMTGITSNASHIVQSVFAEDSCYLVETLKYGEEESIVYTKDNMTLSESGEEFSTHNFTNWTQPLIFLAVNAGETMFMPTDYTLTKADDRLTISTSIEGYSVYTRLSATFDKDYKILELKSNDLIYDNDMTLSFEYGVQTVEIPSKAKEVSINKNLVKLNKDMMNFIVNSMYVYGSKDNEGMVIKMYEDDAEVRKLTYYNDELELKLNKQSEITAMGGNAYVYNNGSYNVSDGSVKYTPNGSDAKRHISMYALMITVMDVMQLVDTVEAVYDGNTVTATVSVRNSQDVEVKTIYTAEFDSKSRPVLVKHTLEGVEYKTELSFGTTAAEIPDSIKNYVKTDEDKNTDNLYEILKGFKAKNVIDKKGVTIKTLYSEYKFSFKDGLVKGQEKINEDLYYFVGSRPFNVDGSDCSTSTPNRYSFEFFNMFFDADEFTLPFLQSRQDAESIILEEGKIIMVDGSGETTEIYYGDGLVTRFVVLDNLGAKTSERIFTYGEVDVTIPQVVMDAYNS